MSDSRISRRISAFVDLLGDSLRDPAIGELSDSRIDSPTGALIDSAVHRLIHIRIWGFVVRFVEFASDWPDDPFVDSSIDLVGAPSIGH